MMFNFMNFILNPFSFILLFTLTFIPYPLTFLLCFLIILYPSTFSLSICLYLTPWDVQILSLDKRTKII